MAYLIPEVGRVPHRTRERRVRERVRERAPAPYAAARPDVSAATPDRDALGPDAIGPDTLDELADEIRVLAAHLHAGTRELLGLVARFDAAGGWKPGGHRGCENWLSLNTGVALRTAREYVRVARALEALPETGASMGRGALSLCQVRALTRVATAETEADLLALAEGGWTVEWWGRDRHLVFVDPRGQAHGSLRRPPPLPDDPVETLVRRNRARGVVPDADTAPARWQRERDIPDGVLFRALEATAPG